MKKKTIFLLAFLLGCMNLSASSNAKLRFRADGTFKIVQFSDIHWKHGSSKCEETVKIIETILEREKPDFVMLTGDIAWRSDTDQPWYDIPKIFERNNVLFTATLGNHDDETPVPREKIYDYFEKSPNFIGEAGPKELIEVGSIGNFVIPIYAHDSDKIAHLLYFMDLWKRPMYRVVEWYRNQSDKFTKKHKGVPYPAHAVFHIPVHEFNDIIGDKGTIGTYREHVCPHGDCNPGIFEAFYEKKDVMGVICGHDHLNDYAGIYYGIGLTYARVTGEEVWGLDDHGSRVFELYEGERRYKTWIHTPNVKELIFNYPSGINSVDEATLPFQPGLNVTPNGEKGMAYDLYVNNDPAKDIREAADRATMPKQESGVLQTFRSDKAPTDATGGYWYDLQGLLDIPADGVYRFDLMAHFGGTLYIDDVEVTRCKKGPNFTGTTNYGKANLGKGIHKVRLVYYKFYKGTASPMTMSLSICDKEGYPKALTPDMMYVP